MSDDRDRRRDRDPLHARPDSGRGRVELARTAAGEVESSDDAWRDDPTPVGGVRRPVVVDARAFEADIRWAEFEEIRDEVRECRKDRLARAKRQKWVTGLLTGAVGSIVAALIYAAQAIDARGVARQVDREHQAMNARHEVEIRELQTETAAMRALLDILLRRHGAQP